MSDRRILIVAHRTAASPKLLAAVTERAARGPCKFTLLVPRPYWDPDTEEAAITLELAIPLLDAAAGSHVRAGGRELHLTSLEQSLLYLLAENAGRLLTRDEILNYLWGADYEAESNVVDRHIRNLRVKLQDHSRPPRYIATVPGRGYRFLLTAAGPPTASPAR